MRSSKITFRNKRLIQEKYKKYRNSESPSQELLPVDEESLALMMSEAKEASTGIEADENHVYFYSQVGEKEALELIRLIRRLDIEMSYLANRLGLNKNPPIHLYIHSPGGDVFSGLSICDAIDACKTDVYTYIEGSAASAATLIASRGKKRFMNKRSFMLIHQPQMIWAGKHDEFLDEIENQKHIFNVVKDVYLDTCKIDEEKLSELLRHELWLPAEKCLEYGFIDKII